MTWQNIVVHVSQVLNVVLSIPFCQIHVEHRSDGKIHTYPLIALFDFMSTHHSIVTEKQLNVKGWKGFEIHFDEKTPG